MKDCGLEILCINQGPYGFWKVMEIENVIFQDLESFGKERIFEMAMAKFGFLFGKFLKIP